MNEQMKTKLKIPTTMQVWCNTTPQKSKNSNKITHIQPKKMEYGNKYTLQVSKVESYKKEDDGWGKEYHTITLIIEELLLNSADIKNYNGLLKITGKMIFSAERMSIEGKNYFKTVYNSPLLIVDSIEKVDSEKQQASINEYKKESGGRVEFDNIPF